MWQALVSFRRNEDGAVSADWVILTAGMVLFAALVATLVKTGAEDGGQDIANQVAGMSTP